MITILGAGGAISNELVRRLAPRDEPIRLVSRSPEPAANSIETIAADVADLEATVRAVAGSRVVVLLVGLKYDVRVWRELWPRVMDNAIEASKRAGAKLVFFDNVYMYGRVDGPMTEETPFRPSSKKGEIRAEITTRLLNEMQSGGLTALIARAADFYGPNVRTGIPNLMVFDKLAKGGAAMWLANDSVKHSFTFTPDAARGLILLLDDDGAWNQTWHLPTRPFRQLVRSSSNSSRKNSTYRRNTACSNDHSSRWQDCSIPKSANSRRCCIRTNSTTFSIQRSSTRDSLASRRRTLKASG